MPGKVARLATHEETLIPSRRRKKKKKKKNIWYRKLRIYLGKRGVNETYRGITEISNIVA